MKTTLLLLDVSDAFSSRSRRDFSQRRGERSAEASSCISEGLQQRSCRTEALLQALRRFQLGATSAASTAARL